MPHNHYKLTLAVSLGGMLELYDFLIYGLMATYISQQFFPADDPLVSLMGAFATFAVGYMTRPLGGLLFGHLGDKYGRKKNFTLSILLMATSTALMGCLPVYNSIGLAAPILLVLLRLVQGFSLGGEIPGAMTYLSESAPDQQGRMMGILFSSFLLGICLGTSVHGILALYLDSEAMMAWGWRIPFWLGGSLGVLSYFIRKRFRESGLFMALDQAKQQSSIPLAVMLRSHRQGLARGLLIMSISCATVGIYAIYMPSYLNLLGFDSVRVAWNTTFAFLVISPLSILFGILTDKCNHKPLFVISIVFIALATWPSFLYFSSDHAPLRNIMLICGLLSALSSGLLPPLLVNCFPTEVRYTGIATCYNLCVTLFGGLAPFMATLLISQLGRAAGPACYLIMVAVLSFGALLLKWPKQKQLE